MPVLNGIDLGLFPTMGVGSYASPSWLLAARRVVRAGDAGPADMEEEESRVWVGEASIPSNAQGT